MIVDSLHPPGPPPPTERACHHRHTTPRPFRPARGGDARAPSCRGGGHPLCGRRQRGADGGLPAQRRRHPCARLPGRGRRGAPGDAGAPAALVPRAPQPFPAQVEGRGGGGRSLGGGARAGWRRLGSRRLRGGAAAAGEAASPPQEGLPASPAPQLQPQQQQQQQQQQQRPPAWRGRPGARAPLRARSPPPRRPRPLRTPFTTCAARAAWRRRAWRRSRRPPARCGLDARQRRCGGGCTQFLKTFCSKSSPVGGREG